MFSTSAVSSLYMYCLWKMGKWVRNNLFYFQGYVGILILELGNLILDVSDTSGIGVGVFKMCVFLVFIILS